MTYRQMQDTYQEVVGINNPNMGGSAIFAKCNIMFSTITESLIWIITDLLMCGERVLHFNNFH